MYLHAKLILNGSYPIYWLMNYENLYMMTLLYHYQKSFISTGISKWKSYFLL